MRKWLLITVAAGIFLGCVDQKKQAEKIFRHYLDQKTSIIQNYSKESSLALWNATVSGKESDYKKLIDIEMDFSKLNGSSSSSFSPDNFSTITHNIFTSEEDFELLKKLKFSGLITDTLLSRQLIYLYHSFTSSQIESKKYKKLLESKIKLTQQARALKYQLDGKTYSLAQIDSIRRSTTNSQYLEQIMETRRQVARKIAPDIVQLVKDRNSMARDLGFPDYYHLQLESIDESPERIQSLISEIEEKTRGSYYEAKVVIDKSLAGHFGISALELRPWHYYDGKISYWSKAYISKLDSLLAQTDPITRASAFFEGIGLPIQDIIDKSKLRNGSTDATFVIDFNSDVRIIANIANTFDGLTKILHEGAHATHYKNISEDLPYLLKGPSLFITEGVATYFSNMALDSLWLNREVASDKKTQKQVASICRHFRQVDQLFRIRKQMVFAEFEREIYMSPDQDLDLLWHNLNLKYLGIVYPKEKGTCLWATNRYFTDLSCNVQNYIVADIFAAQLKHTIDEKILNGKPISIQGNKAVGKYLIDNLYKYGDLFPWEKLVEKSTGEPLNPQYYVNGLMGKGGEKKLTQIIGN